MAGFVHDPQYRSLCRRKRSVAEKMNHEVNIYGNDGDARKGAAVYTPAALALYDLAVLRFSNSFVWQCPSQRLLDLYNQHISDNHLDIGVGTGYFLDKCRFPSATPKIALFDLNPNSLAKSAKRLRRYNPSCYIGNVLDPIDIGMSGFGSISLNYLLHCLPGNLATKSIVFESVKPLLRDGGVIFGSTILGEGVRHNPLAKQLLKIYNAKGIFSNLSDRQSDLEAGLNAHFDEHTIHTVGSVALFIARKRKARSVAEDRKGLGESRHLQHQQHQ
jgi:hypothetical protein